MATASAVPRLLLQLLLQVRPWCVLRVTPLLMPGLAEDIAATLTRVEVTCYRNENLRLNWGLAQAAEPDVVPNTVTQCLSRFDFGCGICLQLWMQLAVRMGDGFWLNFSGICFFLCLLDPMSFP